jgi:hypothetical protein
MFFCCNVFGRRRFHRLIGEVGESDFRPVSAITYEKP